MIKYINGDATNPKELGDIIIAHINNDCGGWGFGFVKSVSKRWKKPETFYRSWYKNQSCPQNEELYKDGLIVDIPFELGQVQIVKVEDYENPPQRIYVANMVAQAGLISEKNAIPLQYDALESCLIKLNEYAFKLGRVWPASIHMPRIGCGLAGGEWSKIEKIIVKCMPDLNITVYDFVDPNSIDTQIPWRK